MQRIPKIIHYCWFGRGPLTALANKCLDSWREHLPDYRLQLWNEDNFDVTQNEYVRQAYQAAKYAFVTDYVRLFALYHVGGVYMDTDVQVLKNLDGFLDHSACSGFESATDVPTALWAAEPQHSLTARLLDQYSNRQFFRQDGSMDLTTNVSTISTYLKSRGLVCNNRYQCVEGLHLYPQHVFCAKCRVTHELQVTPDTYAIHHFAGSWFEPSLQLRIFKFAFERPITRILGKRAYARWFEFAKRLQRRLSGKNG